MIEAMEQQIINSINNRWTKDKKKRREIDIERISECFRIICSSRNSTLNIVHKLKESDEYHEELVIEVKNNMRWIYNWTTKDMIESLLKKYSMEVKDKKKEAEYNAEIPEIKEFLEQLEKDIIEKTFNKLLAFHMMKIGEKIC